MTELKLEVGKTYLNGYGEKVNIIGKTVNISIILKGNDLSDYTSAGKYLYGNTDRRLDLVSEFIEPPEHKLEIGKKYICDDWAEQAEFVFIKNQIYYFFDEKYGFSWFGFEYLLKNNIREYKETKIVEGTVAVCYHNGIGLLTTEHSEGNEATIKLTYNCDTQEVKAEVVK